MLVTPVQVSVFPPEATHPPVWDMDPVPQSSRVTCPAPEDVMTTSWFSLVVAL